MRMPGKVDRCVSTHLELPSNDAASPVVQDTAEVIVVAKTADDVAEAPLAVEPVMPVDMQ